MSRGHPQGCGVSDLIPLAAPNLRGKETEYTAQAISREYIGPSGPFVERFEAMVAKASGRKWAVATITGTAAIHASLELLDVRGKSIFAPRDAFPAGRNVLTIVGAEPFPAGGGEHHDVQFYAKLCDRAPAIGEPPILIADLESYSFAANKIVTCGQGGAVVGDDLALMLAVRAIINQGRDRLGKFNYRMADINAAVGCAQMERLDELKEAKRRIWRRYADAGIPMMERGNSRWMATTTRRLDINALRNLGIEAREECGGVSLPCGTGLTEAEQDTVIKCVASLS